MNYLDFGGVFSRMDLLISGAILTMQVSLLAMLFALCLATLVAVMQLSRFATVRFVAVAYIEAIRNTPFIVQLFVIYFGLPAIGMSLEPLPSAILAMTFYGGAYTSEIIRAGIQAVSKGQIEAGKSLGMSTLDIFRYIIIKPAIAAVYPSMVSQFILLLLSSSVVSAISVPELTGIGNDIQGITLRNMEVYLVIAAMYVALVALLKGGLTLIERRVFPFKFLKG
ncbi:amino acid ABC transporter permease [uncultured Cohaesibacter sp.]|uniref:amino acid ABC transporter permease n=1 Tax=uncultured Cohaesibacter sp. TaxID=1002546 RepID=UPI00292D90A5|nr:amino acid ABC transporter permease [uncultured Cohaesibacter sp.]